MVWAKECNPVNSEGSVFLDVWSSWLLGSRGSIKLGGMQWSEMSKIIQQSQFSLRQDILIHHGGYFQSKPKHILNTITVDLENQQISISEESERVFTTFA